MTTDQRIEEAKKLHSEALKKTLDYAAENKIDLLEVSISGCPCEECAKYQGRIYSISGNDKRFPKYPDWLLYDACPHNCGLISYPYIDGFSEPTYIEGDIIEVSNRPFVDDRTPEQIAVFEARRDKILKERQYRMEYEQLQKLLPDDAPKNLGAYLRMKNSKSKGYFKLKEKAKDAGLEI